MSLLLPNGNIFFVFAISCSQKYPYFLQKKKKYKKKDFAAARLATISATCWTGNKLRPPFEIKVCGFNDRI